jgi:hypothetical protein
MKSCWNIISYSLLLVGFKEDLLSCLLNGKFQSRKKNQRQMKWYNISWNAIENN